MTIEEVNDILMDAVHRLRSNQLSARKAGALVQLCTALMRTLPAADLEARVTRLEEQAAEQVLAPVPDVGPDSGPGKGSAAPDDAEPVEPDGKLVARSEEEVPEWARAASDVEQGASSNNGARTKEDTL